MTSQPHSIEALLEHASWIRRLAKSLVGDPHVADELTQETWMRALEHPPALDRPVRGWLATVMRNVWRQRLRREGYRSQREERAARPERDGLADEPADEIVDRAWMHRDLVEQVMAHDEPYRTTILARYFDGLTPSHIAERHDVSLSTVKSRLTRGLEKLRERLDQRSGGDRSRWLSALVPFARYGETAAAPTPLVPLTPSLSTELIGVSLVNLKLAGLVLLVSGAVAAAVIVTRDSSTSVAAPPAVAAAPSPELAPAALLQTGELPVATVAGQRAPAVAPTPAPAQQVDPAKITAHESIVIRGRVIDAHSNPVPGLTVQQQSGSGYRAGMNETTATLASTTSELGGRFALETQRPGGSIAVDDPRWVTVLVGRGTDEVVVVVAPRIELVGRVIDEAGRPLTDVTLRVKPPATFRADIDAILDNSGDLGFHTTTDADGRFAFAAAPALADARLTAGLEGFVAHDELAPQQSLRDLTIVLQRPERGERELRGIVVDADGRAVPDAYVAFGIDTTRSGEDGRFRFDLDAEATFNALFERMAARILGADHTPTAPDELRALAPGYLPAQLAARSRTPEGDAIWPDPIVLTLDSEPFSIEGRVVGSDGEALAGIDVWLADPTLFGGLGDPDSGAMPQFLHMETMLVGGDSMWQSTTTDDEGRFRIDGLLDREYTVAAMDRSTLQREEVLVDAGETRLEIEITSDGLYPVLAGRVLTLSGEPLEGVNVHPMCDAFRLRYAGQVIGTRHGQTDAVVTDAEGRFELVNVPRNLAYLRLDGAQTLPLEWGRHVEGGLYELVGEDADAVEIHLSRRCHFQVELADPDRADGIAVLDEDERKLEISEFRGNSRREGPFAELVQGRSATLAVGEEARMLVLYRDGAEVERIAIELSPHEKRTVEL